MRLNKIKTHIVCSLRYLILIYDLQNGTLKIIDRRKHIFKLSQGEYIVPEKIENIYIRSQYVEQVFVHGESLKVTILLNDLLYTFSKIFSEVLF